MLETVEYISWLDATHWSSDIILGTKNKRYKFDADWNTRSNSWYISIKYQDEIIITGVNLVLGVNLLALCNEPDKPECVLYARSENQGLKRITYNSMVSGLVKLYHIIPENVL